MACRVAHGPAARAGHPHGGEFDAVLLDAPCSGNGTLASRPDARWHHQGDDAVAALAKIQGALLANAATLVRPGGRLVYAVCTIAPAENAGALAAAGLEPASERTILPVDGATGFYAATVSRPS